jgi:hypothetical protein
MNREITKWRIDLIQKDKIQIRPEGGSVAVAYAWSIVGNEEDKQNLLANAKLIAAAPELLNACREALKHHQGGHSSIGATLAEAIDKATK